jgi:two-component system, LytTR family, sensor kinase
MFMTERKRYLTLFEMRVKLPFSRWYLWMVGVALVLLTLLQMYSVSVQEGREFRWLNMSIFWILNYSMWVVLAPFIYRLVVYYKTEKSLTLRTFSILLFWGLAVSLFHYSVVTSLESIIKAIIYNRSPFSNVLGTLVNYITTSSISHFLDYIVITALFVVVHLYKSMAQEKMQKISLESELRRTQLNALRMQLNPHFLFNTLNTISSIIGKNEQGQKVVSSLGDLLRVMLKEEKSIIPLSKELSYLKMYLDIEEIRFQDRLSIKIDIDEKAWSWPIPNLILQPVVENSIKHGLAKSEGHVELNIAAYMEHECLVVCIKDNGAGLRSNFFKEGIGISNLRKRLLYHYGDEKNLTLEFDKPKGCTVTIKFPSTENTLILDEYD